MTESACVISKSTADDLTTGHVGPPAASCEIKLVDVPDMQYMTSDLPLPRVRCRATRALASVLTAHAVGRDLRAWPLHLPRCAVSRACVPGPCPLAASLAGYFKDPVETAAALDSEGWLHTGDIGTWLPGGRLKIIDRKKDLVKLAQGEYVALAKVENAMKQSVYVEQALCYAVSTQAHCVGLVVPNPETLRAWASANGMPEASTPWEALCASPAATAEVLRSVTAACKGKLMGFETPTAIALVADAWSVANDCLTPTMKLKRAVIVKKHSGELSRLYAQARPSK